MIAPFTASKDVATRGVARAGSVAYSNGLVAFKKK